jgi:hypothetical protein
VGKRPAKKAASKKAAGQTPFCDLLVKMAKNPSTCHAVYSRAAQALVQEHGITEEQAFALLSGDGLRMETCVRLEANGAGIIAYSGPTPLHTIGPPFGHH